MFPKFVGLPSGELEIQEIWLLPSRLNESDELLNLESKKEIVLRFIEGLILHEKETLCETNEEWPSKYMQLLFSLLNLLLLRNEVNSAPLQYNPEFSPNISNEFTLADVLCNSIAKLGELEKISNSSNSKSAIFEKYL